MPKSLILFLVFLTISILAIEVITAATDLLVPAEFRDRQRLLHGFLQPDPKLGFIAKTNQRDYLITWSETGVEGRYSTDEFGFRNYGRNYSSGKIFFVGDSFTWGVWLPREATFPDLVENALNVPVINLAQQGYYIEQYELVLKRFLNDSWPRIVALCIFANDLAPAMGSDDLAHFYERFGWDKYETYPPSEKRFLYRVGRTLAAWDWLGEETSTGVSPGPFDLATAGSGMRFYRRMGAIPDYFTNRRNDNTEAIFRRTLQFIHSQGATPLVFLLPSKESAYQDTYLRLFPGSYLSIEEEGYRRLCEIAQSENTSCTDLTATFRANSRQSQTFFTLDPHWNARGHQVAAEQMSKVIEPFLNDHRLKGDGLGYD
jgi:lysophospholipase L1-like esterase